MLSCAISLLHHLQGQRKSRLRLHEVLQGSRGHLPNHPVLDRSQCHWRRHDMKCYWGHPSTLKKTGRFNWGGNIWAHRRFSRFYMVPWWKEFLKNKLGVKRFITPQRVIPVKSTVWSTLINTSSLTSDIPLRLTVLGWRKTQIQLNKFNQKTGDQHIISQCFRKGMTWYPPMTLINIRKIPINSLILKSPNKISRLGVCKISSQVFIQIHRGKSRGSAEAICQGTIWSHQPPTILLVALDTIQHDHKARCHIG